MNSYFVDLHIHLGATATGKPVKITASKSLTLENVLIEASTIKGLDLVGIIDCHVPEVLDELELLMEKKELIEDEEGGLCYKKMISLFLGSEIEIYDQYSKGPIHVIAFFPYIKLMRQFSKWFKENVTNVTLSTQRIYVDGKTLQLKIKELGGLFIPAHVFTPFKSLYGKGVEKSLTEVFDHTMIDAIELGLSSDTSMASEVAELSAYPFLSNSDAHSLGNIAREYQKIKMKKVSFFEFQKALKNEDGREIECNYGLNPFLGKYYSTTCDNCNEPIIDQSIQKCPKCHQFSFTKGVSIRIKELATTKKKVSRPPYVHQVPLSFIPSLGPKTLEKLRNHFKTEMNIIHNAKKEELEEIVSEKIANYILKARSGQLSFSKGGGGKYGKVK